MREFVRAELPELIVVSERARTMIARSPTGFALLAAIGAALLVGSVLTAIASLAVDLTRPERAHRPFEVSQLIAPVAAVVVAQAAGGTSGALAYIGYFMLALASRSLGAALTCSRLAELCPSAFGPADQLATAAPGLMGLALGVLAARFLGASLRPGANSLLEGAGAHVLPSVIFTAAGNIVGYRPADLPQQALVFGVLTVVAARRLPCGPRSCSRSS